MNSSTFKVIRGLLDSVDREVQNEIAWRVRYPVSAQTNRALRDLYRDTQASHLVLL